MEEREFYSESQSNKPANLNCPFCKQSNSYDIRWLTRTKKDSLPARASEQDKMKFAKARSYMVRVDDVVVCKNGRCRKRFEVAGLQSVVLL